MYNNLKFLSLFLNAFTILPRPTSLSFFIPTHLLGLLGQLAQPILTPEA